MNDVAIKDLYIDKEKLRKDSLSLLTRLKGDLDKIYADGNNDFWGELHNMIALENDEERKSKFRSIESQLLGLGEFLGAYIGSALDTPERFELFVKIKAAEIGGEDSQHSYFWALQIRKDQLLSLNQVVGEVVNDLKLWIKKPIQIVVNDDKFNSYGEKTIEDMIYIEAENKYKMRIDH